MNVEGILADGFADGHVIDAILLLVACEAVVLVIARRRHGRPLVPLLCNLGSGAALMLAVRAALTGAPWPAVAACLAAAFVAHGTELGLRLRSGPDAPACGKPARGPAGTAAETVAFPSHDLI